MKKVFENIILFMIIYFHKFINRIVSIIFKFNLKLYFNSRNIIVDGSCKFNGFLCLDIQKGAKVFIGKNFK
jgi:hypothetical protein